MKQGESNDEQSNGEHEVVLIQDDGGEVQQGREHWSKAKKAFKERRRSRKLAQEPAYTAIILSEGGSVELGEIGLEFVHGTKGLYIPDDTAVYWLTEPIPAGRIIIYKEGNPDPVRASGEMVKYNPQVLELLYGPWLTRTLGFALQGPKKELDWKKILLYGGVAIAVIALMLWIRGGL